MRDMEQWCVEQGRRQPSSQTVNTSLNDSPSEPYIELKWDDCASMLPFDELGQFLEPEYHQDSNFLSIITPPTNYKPCLILHLFFSHSLAWHSLAQNYCCCQLWNIARFRIPPHPRSVNMEWMGWCWPKDTTKRQPSCFHSIVCWWRGIYDRWMQRSVSSCCLCSPFDKVGVDNSRVSLVFKRALDRGGGKKGHGLAGEGRRSRRKHRIQ